MIFSDNKLLLYLKRNSLEIYSKNTQGVSAKLDFPPNLIKDEEIINQEKFEQLIANFFNSLNLKNQKIVIAISQDLLFEKTLPISSAQEEALTQKFFDEIPFDAQKIAKIQIRTKNGLNLAATNKNLYEASAHVLQKLGGNLEAVVPITMFGIAQAPTLTREDVKKILTASDMLKRSNFLAETSEVPQLNSQSTQSQGNSKRNYLVIGGSAFIILGIVIILILLLKPQFLSGIFSRKQNVIQPSPQEVTSQESTTESSPTADQVNTSRQDLKVQIVSGTATKDQSAIVQGILGSLNYTQIQISNTLNQNLQDTTIQTDPKVPVNLKEELKNELAKSFKNVIVQDLPQDVKDFDIIITTGSPI